MLNVLLLAAIIFLVGLIVGVQIISRKKVHVQSKTKAKSNGIDLGYGNFTGLGQYNPSSLIASKRKYKYYCDDPIINSTMIWCQFPPPEKSFYRFDKSSNNLTQWKEAQNIAIEQKPILLERIIQIFNITNNHLENLFLDGDIPFRRYHSLFNDYFLDDNYNFDILNIQQQGRLSLSSLLRPFSSSPPSLPSVPFEKLNNSEKDILFHKNVLNMLKNNPKPVRYEWELKYNLTRSDVLPPLIPLYSLSRVPIFHIGYFVFAKAKPSDPFFRGKIQGEVGIDRSRLLKLWSRSKHRIQHPWIGFHFANENWGLFSTYFPNRTVDWGTCCNDQSKEENRLTYELLNHEKTIMIVTNQHSNLTHPKLIHFPLGIAKLSKMKHILYESMNAIVKEGRKENLLFTSSSNWGYRSNLIQCIGNKFQNQFQLKLQSYNNKLHGRITPRQFYLSLGRSIFGLALPGLGYDTFRSTHFYNFLALFSNAGLYRYVFRLWETLTMGTIPILEKGVGLDKSLWRLPALLVEDFDEVTPELLHQAYLEAIYRVDEFEFERLTLNFWIDFIYNVSKDGKSSKILETFPIESEDSQFVRPREWFTCHETKTCGKGTKKIPKSFC